MDFCANELNRSKKKRDIFSYGKDSLPVRKYTNLSHPLGIRLLFHPCLALEAFFFWLPAAKEEYFWPCSKIIVEPMASILLPKIAWDLIVLHIHIWLFIVVTMCSKLSAIFPIRPVNIWLLLCLFYAFFCVPLIIGNVCALPAYIRLCDGATTKVTLPFRRATIIYELIEFNSIEWWQFYYIVYIIYLYLSIFRISTVRHLYLFSNTPKIDENSRIDVEASIKKETNFFFHAFIQLL